MLHSFDFVLGVGVAHERDLQQYISVEWSPGQKRMDIYLWSLLHGDSAGSIVPQLLTLVFLGLIMISYTAWYVTIAALVHGQVATTFYLPTYLGKKKNLIWTLKDQIK